MSTRLQWLLRTSPRSSTIWPRSRALIRIRRYDPRQTAREWGWSAFKRIEQNPRGEERNCLLPRRAVEAGPRHHLWPWGIVPSVGAYEAISREDDRSSTGW